MCPDRDLSGAWSRYPQPVPIRVFEVALPAGKTRFIDGNLELLRDRVDVLDVQVHECVGPCVPLVFREIEPNASSRYRNEPWKPRLELMLPLLAKSKALIPGDSPSSVLDVQDWDDFFVHASPRLIGAQR